MRGFDNLLTDLKVHSLERDLWFTLYGLDNLRRTLMRDEWKAFCKTQIVNYPLHKQLLNDPFTRRGFEKPRGYAGDPDLLDYLYGFKNYPDFRNNPIGRKVFSFITDSDPGGAIRYRRKYIAQLLEKMPGEFSLPISILALEPGYLREIELSATPTGQKIKRYVAYDHDIVNINFIKEQYGHLNITAHLGRMTDLQSYSQSNNKFEFIYATGLMDYLDENEARKLIRWMFDNLQDNGFLLVSNFRENIPNTLYRTYMEAFIDWFLVYRTDEEFINLFTILDPDRVKSFKYSIDPLCNISFGLIQKQKRGLNDKKALVHNN